MDFKPQKGSLAFCSKHSLGLITQDAMKEVTYADGSTAMTYVGVHLTDKIAPMGSPWSSRTPHVCGRLILIPGTITYTVEAQGNGRVFLFN